MPRWFWIFWATAQLSRAAEPSAAGLPPAQTDAITTNRAQITIAYNSEASSAFVVSPAAVQNLVNTVLSRFEPGSSATQLWKSWIQSNDVVGFKVLSAPGPLAGTRPALLRALVESLIASGHPRKQIVIWDRRLTDLREAGFTQVAEALGVRCEGADTQGWDPAKSYESPVPGKLVFGDFEFGNSERRDLADGRVGRRSFVGRLLSQEITRIVTVVPLLNHNSLGTFGHIASLGLGGVDNTLRFEDSRDRLAEALPEICALDEIYPKLAVCFTDALYCQFRGEERTQLHYTVALNELWCSTDPVALDVWALRELAAARARAPAEGEKPPRYELYRNCELLELGVADEKRIDVRRVP